eukprot:12264377-Ditylum_brightwellii.AAC.1
MMHKPRHISICKWIARVVNLNNYLTEFPTPIGIDTKKLEEKEILEKPVLATKSADSRESQTFFKCRDSLGVPKQGLQATEK